MISFSHLNICNPKRETEMQTGRASWYPYYAGFSGKFATRLIASAKMNTRSVISDPWNGSGTTTAAAAGLGHDAFGCDLNPVMVLAARARMLSKREKTSLVPVGATISKAAVDLVPTDFEPLATWFAPLSAVCIRALERAIQRVLVDATLSVDLLDERQLQKVSDLAAFFYVALFRTTRQLLRRFAATNPTWLKRPTSPQARLRPTRSDILTAFTEQVKFMADAIPGDALTKDSEVNVILGSSDKLPLGDESVDLVLSSPPYCTRIDYAVATRIELAVLGYRIDAEFDELRRKLIGTTTVPKNAPPVNLKWGEMCSWFLDKLTHHESKASATYYLKNHLQYFDAIYNSLGEIARTLKSGGGCALVVQDSYYKDVHIDLPAIVSEMSFSHGLVMKRRVSFVHAHTMAAVNPDVRKYRDSVTATESVLCFSRN